MPKTVRNFWVTCEVDGVTTPISTGPRAADGGFNATVLARHNGEVAIALTITGEARTGGGLVTTVRDGNGQIVFEHHTTR